MSRDPSSESDTSSTAANTPVSSPQAVAVFDGAPGSVTPAIHRAPEGNRRRRVAVMLTVIAVAIVLILFVIPIPSGISFSVTSELGTWGRLTFPSGGFVSLSWTTYCTGFVSVTAYAADQHSGVGVPTPFYNSSGTATSGHLSFTSDGNPYYFLFSCPSSPTYGSVSFTGTCWHQLLRILVS